MEQWSQKARLQARCFSVCQLQICFTPLTVFSMSSHKKLYNMDLRPMNSSIDFPLQSSFFLPRTLALVLEKKKVNDQKITGVKKSFMKHILIKIYFGYHSKGNSCL